MEQPHPSSIFSGLDLQLILYAASMATLISLLMTSRARNAQRLRQQPLSSWWAVIPDTTLGTIAGVVFVLVGTSTYPALHNLAGATTLAGAGGLLGPKIWDLVSAKGLDLLLTWIARTVAGPLSTWAARAAKEGDADVPQSGPPAAPPDAPDASARQ